MRAIRQDPRLHLIAWVRDEDKDYKQVIRALKSWKEPCDENKYALELPKHWNKLSIAQLQNEREEDIMKGDKLPPYALQ